MSHRLLKALLLSAMIAVTYPAAAMGKGPRTQEWTAGDRANLRVSINKASSFGVSFTVPKGVTVTYQRQDGQIGISYVPKRDKSGKIAFCTSSSSSVLAELEGSTLSKALSNPRFGERHVSSGKGKGATRWSRSIEDRRGDDLDSYFYFSHPKLKAKGKSGKGRFAAFTLPVGCLPKKFARTLAGGAQITRIR